LYLSTPTTTPCASSASSARFWRMLPVKKAIRTAAGIQAGDDVDVELLLQFEG
jgi:hypothetical protein